MCGTCVVKCYQNLPHKEVKEIISYIGRSYKCDVGHCLISLEALTRRALDLVEREGNTSTLITHTTYVLIIMYKYIFVFFYGTLDVCSDIALACRSALCCDNNLCCEYIAQHLDISIHRAFDLFSGVAINNV